MQIGLLTLLKALWKRMWLVILAVLLCGAAGKSNARLSHGLWRKSPNLCFLMNRRQPWIGRLNGISWNSLPRFKRRSD